QPGAGLTRLRLEESALIRHLRTLTYHQAIKFQREPRLTDHALKKRVGRAAHLAGKQLEWAPRGDLLARISDDVEPTADRYGDAIETLEALRDVMAALRA